MKNTTREKILAGGKAFGTFSHLGSAYAIEALGLIGLDYVIIDTEHGPFSEEASADFIRAAEMRGISPFVRVRDSSRPAVLRMLDIGAQGLIVPNVRSVEEVRALVSYSKYFPMGERGVAFGRGSGFGRMPFAQDKVKYFDICNREQLLIPQCETKGCLDNIEEIAAIEGVDGIFVGPADLSVALGKPTVYDEAHAKAIERVLAACKAAGKLSFIYTSDAAGSQKYLKMGYDSVTQGSDAGFLMAGATAAMKAALE